MNEILLKLERISKQFGALSALTDVSIVLGAGEVHALVGPEGAGKTTLAEVICGRLRQDRGRLQFAGRDISRTSLAERVRLGIARTQSMPGLCSRLTTFEHLQLALHSVGRNAHSNMKGDFDHPELDVYRILRRMDLHEYAKTMARDLDLRQQKLLEIAMALLARPRLLVLDEPLAGLSYKDRENFSQFLKGLKISCTLLLIEHELSSVRGIADRVWVIAEGRVIASGSADAQWSNADVRSAYFGQGPDHA